jgi:tetratricopeptide (TPR) repeat protein
MTARSAATERWSLVDRRDFLRRSLDDADREHEAGDLDDADYEVLRRRDLAALAEVEEALDGLEASERSLSLDDADPVGHDRSGGPPRVRRKRRTWLAVVGAAALVAGVVVLVTSLMTSRLPGQVATGSIKTSQAQEIERGLAQAVALVGEGQDVQALRAYEGVLAVAPDQPTALAEMGWLEWESASQSHSTSLEDKGQAEVAKAVRVAPGFYAARAYLGTIEVDRGDAAAAVAQYRKFLADHPPNTWVKDYAPEIRTAFSHDGQPLPAGVPAASG